MTVLPMTETAKVLGIHRQTLSYYYGLGKLTGTQAGHIVLIDPERAKKELEELGFFHRRQSRKTSREKNA